MTSQITEKSPGSRIEFIDIAKGIAIFLVIFAHSPTNQDYASGNYSSIYTMIYAFHMPLFFLLSGLSISTRPCTTWKGWGMFIKKSILTMMVPYLIWALIYCNFSYANVPWILYGSWQGLSKTETLTSLWYLPALFIGKVLVEVIVSYTGRKLWLPIAVVLAVISLLLPQLSIGYPLCFNIGLMAAALILLGVFVKEPLLRLSGRSILALVGIMAACAAVFAGTMLLDGEKFTLLWMCKGYYGESLLWIVRALVGSIFVLALALIISKDHLLLTKASKAVSYAGQYTMGIFILHKPFLQQVLLPLMMKIPGMPLGLTRFLASLIAMLLCLPVCNIIMYYIPELIGIFSKDKIILKQNADA